MSNTKEGILSKSANRVQNAILEKRLSFKVVELPSSTRTAQEVADSIGCQVHMIQKVMKRVRTY